MEPLRGHHDIKNGRIIYDEYAMQGNTDITLTSDDSIVIKDTNGNNKLKLSMKNDDLIF